MNCLKRGDCLELMKDIPDKTIDMILCDLPYGTTASEWDKCVPADEMWHEYERIISDTGSIVLFSSGIFTLKLMESNPKLYKYKYVWIKRSSTNFVHAKNRPLTKHEDILVFSKAPMGHKSQLGERRMTYNPQGLIPCNKKIKAGKNKFGTIAGERPSHKNEFIREYTNYPNDILDNFPEVSSSKRLHTNEKPVDLLEFLIKTYTNEGETVLDNCMGSGSTGIACINTDRSFIGMESSQKYFDIAFDRVCSVLQDKECGYNGHSAN